MRAILLVFLLFFCVTAAAEDGVYGQFKDGKLVIFNTKCMDEKIIGYWRKEGLPSLIMPRLRAARIELDDGRVGGACALEYHGRFYVIGETGHKLPAVRTDQFKPFKDETI